MNTFWTDSKNDSKSSSEIDNWVIYWVLELWFVASTLSSETRSRQIARVLNGIKMHSQTDFTSTGNFLGGHGLFTVVVVHATVGWIRRTKSSRLLTSTCQQKWRNLAPATMTATTAMDDEAQYSIKFLPSLLLNSVNSSYTLPFQNLFFFLFWIIR